MDGKVCVLALGRLIPYQCTRPLCAPSKMNVAFRMLLFCRRAPFAGTCLQCVFNKSQLSERVRLLATELCHGAPWPGACFGRAQSQRETKNAVVSGVAVRLGLAVHPSHTCTCSAVQLSLLQLMPAVLLCGVQSSGASTIAPGKSFCCLGIIQACPTSERGETATLHKNV